MEELITPSSARNNLFNLIKNVNRDSKPVFIAGATEQKSAVMISKKDYDAMQETLALFANGQAQAAIERENDEEVDLDEMIAEIDNER